MEGAGLGQQMRGEVVMMDADVSVRDLRAEAPAVRVVMPEDLAQVGEELAAYHAHYAPYFARREQRAWAEVYLRGLLVADVPRKNTEALALRLLGAGPHAGRQVRALQQFIGEGAWDDDALLAEHRRLVDASLGEEEGVLIVDGSEVAKRGAHSVGVARQWCGSTGKTDNCQAGVYLGYASRRGYTLLDRRLYLPKTWFAQDHQARWKACAIPATVRFATKTELAAQMVEHLRQAGTLRARWLTCDEWYGRHAAFLDRVATTGLWYLAEVPTDTAVWPLSDPATGAPSRRPQQAVPPRAASGKGRRPTKERLTPESPPPVRVDLLAAQMPPTRWQRYRITEGAKGPLVADFVALRAVATRAGLPGPEVWVLLRRAVLEDPDAVPPLKIYLSCAPVQTPLAALVRVCGLRWPIERCFEEGKGELGLDHYELRFWRGWHHHMTLVILAHHFLVLLHHRVGQRGGGHSRPAAAAPGHPSGGSGRAPTRPPASQPGPSPSSARGDLAAAPARPARRPGPSRLSAAAQTGRLSLAS